MSIELLLLTAFLPGVALVTVMFSGGQLSPWAFRLIVSGIFAAVAWISIYFQGLGYVRTGDLLESSSPDWVRLAAAFGPVPAMIEALNISLHPPRHESGAEGVFAIACLAWIPMLHLELVRLVQRRSNNRRSGRDA
jgi:hypothetical protein